MLKEWIDRVYDYLFLKENELGRTSTTEDVMKKYQDVSLEGKTVVITGGNSGIGKETALALAKKKARLILGCRNLEKGEQAVREIKEHVPDASIQLESLRLDSKKSIQDFANKIQEPISILINNAGVMGVPYSETEDGFEMHFGVNHLGHFLLTHLLLPRLEEGSPSRVITVASKAHAMSSIHFDDLKGKDTWNTGLIGYYKAYGQSKTANILFASELDRRMKSQGKNIVSVSLHPGSIQTDLLRNLSSLQRKGLTLLSLFLERSHKEPLQLSIVLLLQK